MKLPNDGNKGLGQTPGARIPLFSAVTSNANGLSAYPSTKLSRDRRSLKFKHVRELRQTHDVVMLQETKLTPRDKTYLNKHDGSLAFYNNFDENRAGVATIIGAKLLKDYTPQQIVSDSDFARGHILQIFMKPKNNRDRPFYLDNIYIKSGSTMAPKCRHIKCIKHSPTDLVFMAGDFNFTEHVKDGSSRLAGPAADAWHTLCNNLGFKEVAQEAHTYKSGNITSRLDRFYTNMDEADRLLITPNAYMRRTASMKYSEQVRRKGDVFFT
jgi:hypothetical protein